MNILVDHNLRGHSVVLAGSLAASGWLDLISIRFVLFEEVGLEINSDDRVVWRCAQANEMILLTASWSAFPCPEHGAGLVQIGALDKRLTPS